MAGQKRVISQVDLRSPPRRRGGQRATRPVATELRCPDGLRGLCELRVRRRRLTLKKGSAISTAPAPAGAPVRDDAHAAAVIHTEDLTKVYPGTDFAAVDKLNLDVYAGEIFGLLGPNGAGKTTTAGILTTRVVPTSGLALLA